jgi:hypothetical protein
MEIGREFFPRISMHTCLLSVIPATYPTHCSSLLSASYQFKVTCSRKLNKIISRISKFSKVGRNQEKRDVGLCVTGYHGAEAMLCRKRHKRISSLTALQCRLDSAQVNFPVSVRALKDEAGFLLE